MVSHHLILSLLHLIVIHFLCAQTQLAVELEGGSGANEGRVILKWHGTLQGTLCAKGFDDIDAQTICNILGKSSSGATATRFPSVGSDNLWILTDLGCQGDETDLQECSHGGWGQPCTENEDAGVICGPSDAVTEAPTTITSPTTTSTSTTTTSPTTTSTSTTTTSPTTTSTSTTTTSPTTTSTSTTTTSPTTTSTSTTTTSPTTTSTSTTTTSPTTTSTSTTTTSPTTTSTSTTTTSPTTTSSSTTTSSPTTTSSSTTTTSPTTTSTSTTTTSPTTTSSSTTTSSPTPTTSTSESLATTTQSAGLEVELTLERSGRLVVELFGLPGFICSDGFDLNDARVVCRSFGEPDTNVQIRNFDHTGGVIWFTNLQCLGSEATISDCYFDDELIITNCSSGQNIGVVCGVDQTRFSIPAFLVGGPDRLHGRLVLQYNGVNGTVCDDQFGTPEATVVCRMFGYLGTDITSGGTYYGAGLSTSRVWLDDVRCTGNETHISDCAHRGWGTSNCDHSEDVGVHCGLRVIPALQTTQVALVDGPDKHHGRLLVRYNNEYGTVCDDGFDINATRVVCRMLGYSGEEVIHGRNYYGRGSYLRNIWLDEVKCNGTEADIAHCSHNEWGRTDCFHSEDVSVLCGPRVSPDRQVQVYLVDGPDRLHGRLIVVYNGKPGTVCDDGFGKSDALVVCRMLGYSGDDVSITSGYPSGSGQIWLSNVLCLGYELSIGDCFYSPWGEHACYHFEDVGINCGPITGSLQVFLVDGPDDRHGRVVLQDNGVNGTVCDDSFDKADARVICRMLGYTGSDVYAAGNLFGSGLSHLNVWLDDLECVGTETDISKCPHGGWAIHDCDHLDDISVLCGPKVAPRPEVPVHLVDGPDRLHGRLIVEYNRQNGTVCDDNFETSDARVICRMLGYRGSQVSVHRTYGPGSGRIWLDEVYCVGNESHIGDCFYPPWGTHDCDHTEDVSVSCGETTVSVPVKAFLVDGPDRHHGRLVLQYNGVNGTVCDDGFTDKDARVVCRMLGYRNSDAYDAGNLYGNGQTSMSILLEGPQCTGNESDISRCPHTGWGVHDCTHEEDVSVLCGPLESSVSIAPKVRVYLVDGPDTLHGRLVVEYNGENGTVCSNAFGVNGARVVCRMLGYSGNDTYRSLNYGPGSGRTWLDDVFCYGHESSISGCLYPPWGTHKCIHLADIGIDCGPIAGSPPYCGSSFSGKIYGGTSAASGAWPQTVKVITYNATNNNHCGGSIIGRQWILTAAHCMYNYVNHKPSIRITAGTTYTGTLYTSGVRVFGSAFWVHPLYRDDSHANDIGLIRLRTPLTYSRNIQPTCLNTVKNVVPTAVCYTAGWGEQREGQSSATTFLRQAKYPIVSDFNCTLFRGFDYASHLCAGYSNGSKTICGGDSGGPLICKRPNSTSWDLWGIAQSSRANGCGPPKAHLTIWTEVAQFLPWIRSITNL